MADEWGSLNLADVPDRPPAAGKLLVANPLLPDPNFDRTVVLLLAYDEQGAVGLVLNRPTETLVGAPLPGWARLAADPPVVFVGGPVSHQDVICLARRAHPGFGAPVGWKAVTADNRDSRLVHGSRCDRCRVPGAADLRRVLRVDRGPARVGDGRRGLVGGRSRAKRRFQ